MTTTTVLSGVLLDDEFRLTVHEVCRTCGVSVDEIVALVQEGVLHSRAGAVEEWSFTGLELQRAFTAIRLQRDLDVNLAGAALALDLLDEIRRLRARLTPLDRQR